MDNEENKTPPMRRGMGRGPRGMRGPAEKPKDFKKAMKNLIVYSKPFAIAIIVAIIFSAISSVLTIIGPDKLSDITDEIAIGLRESINLQSIQNLAITLLIIYISSAVLNYAQSFIMATVSQKFSQKLRNEISEKINNIPLKYFDNTSLRKHTFNNNK